MKNKDKNRDYGFTAKWIVIAIIVGMIINLLGNEVSELAKEIIPNLFN